MRHRLARRETVERAQRILATVEQICGIENQVDALAQTIYGTCIEIETVGISVGLHLIAAMAAAESQPPVAGSGRKREAMHICIYMV